VARKRVEIVACYDRQRRTCIQVERTDKVVKFIPLDVGSGLRVRKLPASEFDNRYQPIVNYPAERACQLYLGYSRNIGASKEALEYLGRVINVSKQEVEMATKKQQVTPKSSRKTEKPAKPGRAVAKPATAKSVKPTKVSESSGRKPSAAQMFQDLIMAGKLTDDQIFEQVQAAFGLDEKKRGYVKWYRNYLRKQGKNPPEPKTAK
jgi:hypothetical protein